MVIGLATNIHIGSRKRRCCNAWEAAWRPNGVLGFVKNIPSRDKTALVGCEGSVMHRVELLLDIV